MQANTFQLTLEPRCLDQSRFEDYFGASNAHVVAHLKTLFHPKFGPVNALLSGPKDVGKSHLLHACYQQGTKAEYQVIYLQSSQHHRLTDDLPLCQAHRPSLVLIDDVDLIAGNQTLEYGLFRWLNAIIRQQRSLVITANNRPQHIGFLLNDLTSRLQALTGFVLDTLSDDDKRQALIYIAEQRGLILKHRTVEYLLSHYPRAMSALKAALHALDKAALIEHKELSINMLKRLPLQGHQLSSEIE